MKDKCQARLAVVHVAVAEVGPCVDESQPQAGEHYVRPQAVARSRSFEFYNEHWRSVVYPVVTVAAGK